mgnify:CR=1 FL=1
MRPLREPPAFGCLDVRVFVIAVVLETRAGEPFLEVHHVRVLLARYRSYETCPDCGRPTREIEEKNWFFRMSAYQERLVAHIRDNPGWIWPEVRRNEVLGFLAGRIATWWMPDAVCFVDEIPHTATGKISKLTLREAFRDYRLPTTDAAE